MYYKIKHMKTTNNTKRKIGKIIVFLIVTVAEFFAIPSQAQGYKGKIKTIKTDKKTYAAITAQFGTRGLLTKSDIAYIDGQRANLQGWESMFMVTNARIGARAGYGAFNTTLSEGNTIDMSSYMGMMNVYVKNGTTGIRPYVLSGLSINAITFKGSYVPAGPKILLNPLQPCTCQLGPVPPPPNPTMDIDMDQTPLPDEPTPPADVDANTGRMTSTQITTGIGAALNLRSQGHYLSIFGEFRYGLPIGTTAQSAAMNFTKVKQNTAITFGLNIGLNGTRKIKYRNQIR